MIKHLFAIAFNLFGLFLLPFVVGFVCALFFEVSQVADTLPYLLLISMVVIAPSFVMLIFGVAWKSRRELQLLRKSGRYNSTTAVATLARHVSVVTPRGWAMFFTGLFFIVLTLSLKWADLSMVAVLALTVFYGVLGVSTFLSAFIVSSFEAQIKKRSSVERQMSPAVILAGEVAEERFTFRRVPVPPLYFLLIEDPLPPRLATTSRYAVGAGARREELTVAGRLRRSPRGMYRLGPAHIYYQDALGLTRVSVASLATAELKVLPRFRHLTIVEPPRSKLEKPDVLTRPHRFPTEDYFRFRDYHSGDDTRRIHWKLSVKSGQMQLRQPETKEISTKNVLLVLDSYLPSGRMLDDAVGVEEVLDKMVEAWISLAKELIERGDRVTLVAGARNQEGELVVEVLPCQKGGHVRWQDIGARVIWQGKFDIPELLKEAGVDSHGVIVSSRFQAPPPGGFDGQSLTWVYLPPEKALEGKDPSLLEALAGSAVNAALWFVRLPFPVGSDENGIVAQFRIFREQAGLLSARKRLREVARANGKRILAMIVSRGDTVYRLDAGQGTHTLVGLTSGTKNYQKGKAA
ncbi:hypothetical protein LBMAG42_43850 [Deltaproteobacteria bacterium]|nr:hypothetical protein LBMAG42_43850 [Deltaproteobacteria bacterium]